MQRIDENTYIDDTLVTCAEYQLFIDEMREKRKYYLPDHWVSDQFLEGQAREPILGVRHSDAIAFCEWLTNREVTEWKYRLPSQDDAANFPMKSIGTSPLGYWIIGDKQARFKWIDRSPIDARTITKDLQRAIERQINPALELWLDHTRLRAVNQDYQSGIDNIRIRIINSVDSLAHIRRHELDVSLRFRFSVDSNIRDILVHVLADALINNSDLERDLGLYIDIFTISERIAGRSPAFEGIRLVKERIR